MRFLIALILLIVAINAVVLPNAQPNLLIAALAMGAIIALAKTQGTTLMVVMIFISSWITTLFYLIVGLGNGASNVAMAQTIIIYILSPLLWILVIDLIWKTFSVEQVVRIFAFLSILAAGSVALYMFLFLNFGSQSVAFFGARSNVHLEEGYSGITMHVSGSLIFLGAAFASDFKVLRSRFLQVVVLFCIALAITASGRTAAIVGLSVGALIQFVSVPGRLVQRLVSGIPVLIVVAIGIKFGMEIFLGVDVIQLIERHFTKITTGGIERPAQAIALLRGANETLFLGAGHGIGVDYVRSTEFPWRYETVFLALVFKLGIVGAVIVLFPILYAIGVFAYRLVTGRLRSYDTFFGAALIACTIAGLSNPYPEAVAFQWLYLVPIYHFLAARHRELSESVGTGPHFGL